MGQISILSIFAIFVSYWGGSSTAFAQDALGGVSCQARGSSLQDFLNQDLSTMDPKCRTELNDSLSSSSPTSCFTDPLSTAPTVSGSAGGLNAASQTQTAAYRLTDTQNQTQKNYCYLHLNRINATCTPEDAKLAVKALSDYADCSEARSVAARSLAAQAGQVANATAAAKPAYQQTAGLSGVLMACYLGVCTLNGGMDNARAIMDPSQTLGHSIEDVETTGSSQPKPRSPSSATGYP